MQKQPSITTQRLLLRPFVFADAARVAELAGDPLIADTTLNIPHPYTVSEAKRWIKRHTALWYEGRGLEYAIVRLEDNLLIGDITLRINRAYDSGEIGYWVGTPFWNQGYCTEAVSALIDFGFKKLDLNRIYGFYLTRNPSSRRVMEKSDMVYEGTFRQSIKKDGQYEDCGVCAILRDDFLARQESS